MMRMISSLHELFMRRLGPPILGAFITAWVILNWEHLLLLFWGNGQLEERIEMFKHAIDQSWYRKYCAPAALALFYLLIMPYLSLVVSALQRHARKNSHNLRVNAEKQLLQAERELSVARVLADPNKNFIEEHAKQNLMRERLHLEKIQAEAEKKQADAEIAMSKATKEKANRAENEVRVQRAEKEKIELELASKIQRAKIASNRYPAIHMIMQFLDSALKDDGISLSFQEITSITTILFGYSNFEKLVNDPRFNNETINKLLGVLYDPETLSEEIHHLLDDNQQVLEHFDPSYLYDYFYEHPQLKLFTKESLDDMAMSFIEGHEYDFFNYDEVISTMAETNSIYSEVANIEFNKSGLNERGYTASFLVTIKGRERRDTSIAGMFPIDINVMLRAPLILGEKGFGQLDIENIDAKVVWPQ